MRSVAVVGPDRGLGAQLCKRFASDGLKVFVAGGTVDAFAFLHKQKRTDWSFEVDVRTSKETW